MLGVPLGLGAATGFAAADVFGGTASKNASPLKVTALARLGGVPATAMAALIVPASHVSVSDVGWGICAGIAQVLALWFLFRALSQGQMGVGAALSGVMASAIPVTWAISRGERVGALGAIGICPALAGVAILSSAKSDNPKQTAGMGVAIEAALSGVCFGLVFVTLGEAHHSSQAIPLLVSQLASTLIGVVLVIATGDSLRAERHVVLMATVAGATAALANGTFVWATHAGVASVMAVFPGLAPVLVAVVARIFLHQTMTKQQQFGVALAVAAAVLLSF